MINLAASANFLTTRAHLFPGFADKLHMSAETHTLAVVPVPFRPAEAQAGELDQAPLLIGPSPAIAVLWSQMRRVAPHFRMMMLTGEPDSGAEAAARVLHDLSPVSSSGFHPLNADDAENIFAGKQGDLPFAPASGTIYLRSVERLSSAAQAGLLRHFYVGAPRALRVIAFTRGGLRPLLSAGSFSSELASALGAVRLRLPALRERVQDLPLLVEHFLQRHALDTGTPLPALSPDFLTAVSKYQWPGNFAQLRTVLTQVLDENAGGPLTAMALGAILAAFEQRSAAEPATGPRLVTLDQVVQEHIRSVLVACNGNKLRAAQVLGISRSTLYRMLETQGSIGEVALAS